MTDLRRSYLIPLLLTSVIGLLYVFFLGNRDPIIITIFSLQLLRGGIALSSSGLKQTDR